MVDGTISIDLTQIIVTVVGGVFSVLGIILTAMVTKNVKDDRMRQILENALKNSLGTLQQATDDQIKKAHFELPDVPAQLAPGVKYVLDHVPEAVERLGVTPESIAEKIDSRIGLANIQANIAIASANNQPIPKPLDQVPANTMPGPVEAVAEAAKEQAPLGNVRGSL